MQLPTLSRFEPGGRGGIGRGGFSHELSLGGTIYFDRGRGWYLSALASCELNQRKLGIDITRGDTVQFQGGAGAHLLDFVDVGMAGYALWQVQDDRGSDLPKVLRGSRDRLFGLGPEVGVAIRPIRIRIALRYEIDFGTRARPEGQIVSLIASLQMLRLAAGGPNSRPGR